MIESVFKYFILVWVVYKLKLPNKTGILGLKRFEYSLKGIKNSIKFIKLHKYLG